MDYIACQPPLPMESSSKNTGVGCHFLSQGIFPTQGSNPRLLHWQVDSLWLSHKASSTYANVVWSLIGFPPFVMPWTAECQAFLYFTISQSMLKLMSIESVMPSNHLILSSPSPPAFNLSQHQGLFYLVCSLHRVAKAWELSFSFSIRPFNEYSGLNSFRTDWFDLFAVQRTLKSLHNSEASGFLALSLLYVPVKITK